ncbi:hypothetical protein [Prosthecobacter sp.]|uniref:hypothetical protein n=1 Tax=Prosthecobacter sp. TaxID=1965333 RepID=UPI003783513D
MKTATYWLELKTAWGKWQEGEPMPALSDAATAYFQNLCFSLFNELLDQRGQCYEGVPRMRGGEEAWAHVFHYLVAKRPRARLRVLDDIFLRARQKAQLTPGLSHLEELKQQMGWILNQFEMRMRDAVRAYAREYGTGSLQGSTTSSDKPLAPGGDDSAGERTLLDVLESVDEDWGTEMERREIQALAQEAATGFFPGVRAPFKLSLFLRALRRRRGVIISVGDPIVVAAAGVGRAVFAQGAVDSLTALIQHVAALPVCQELDLAGKCYFGNHATLFLFDHTEVWVWAAACVKEIIESHGSGGAAAVERLAAFADLLRERLLESGALLSEKEMQPLFMTLETARQNHRR